MTFRRHYGATPEIRAHSLKQAKNSEQKLKKNQEEGLFREKMGRLHMKNQDLSQMATAKMKGVFSADFAFLTGICFGCADVSKI